MIQDLLRMQKLLISVLLLFSFPFAGLASGDSTVRPIRHDTNFYAKYPYRLVIALWQSARHYDVLMEQLITTDTVPGKPSNSNYFADASNVSGFSFYFGLIGFSFGYKFVSAYPDYKVGRTTFYSYGLNFTIRGLRVENSIKHYKGFYDKHSPFYDKNYSDSTRYYQNPSMSIFMYKTKFIYVVKNKKFSLNAAYADTERQLKSSATWLLVGDFFTSHTQADSSIVPGPIKKYYGPSWSSLNSIKALGFSAGGGASGTLVIHKRFYLNLLFSLGLQMQHLKYGSFSGEQLSSVWQTAVGNDLRASFGFNNRNFFMRLSASIDYNYFYTNTVHISQQYYSGEFALGYRFKVKTPGFYKRIEDKIYSYF